MQVQPTGTRDNDSHEPQEAILGVAATPASAENIAEAQGVPAEEKGGPIDIDVIELFEPDVSSNNTSAIAFTNFRLPAIEEDNTESPSTVASTKAYRNQTNSVASSTALVFDKTTSRNNATPNGTGGPHRRNITMVAHLRGEMGNNLSVLAHAYAVKLAIERVFPNISITLVGQHQDAPKWKSAARNLQTCFPSLRDFQFNGGRWMKEYRIRLEQQTTWWRARQAESASRGRILCQSGYVLARVCWIPTNSFTTTDREPKRDRNSRTSQRKRFLTVSNEPRHVDP
jgi:hypothetical protein